MDTKDFQPGFGEDYSAAGVSLEGARATRAAVLEFIEKEVRPNMRVWYRDKAIPRSFFARSAEAGLMSFVEEGGGFRETSAVHPLTVQQTLAEVSPGVAVSLLAHDCLGLYAIHRFGTDRQKEKYFLPAVQGLKIAAFANTEPGTGSDASNITLRAEPVEGGFLLNGTKMFITNGSMADFVVVSAVTDPAAERKHDGISLFIVETGALKRQAIRKEVWVPSDLSTLHFRDVFVPGEDLLGEINGGFGQVMRTFNSSRIAIAALTVGTAVGAFRLAFKRAHSREVFGRPIVAHQAKAFEFAEVWTRIEAARLLTLRAAWLKDVGVDYVLAASEAKLFACELAFSVTRFAAEIFGASGIISENPIHQFPLDAWAAALGEGTNDIQKRVIAAELEKRVGPAGD
jgi:butyryl-CoA dehydrogenase